jgi:hypothetical protein
LQTSLPISKRLTFRAALFADFNGLYHAAKTLHFDLSWDAAGFWKIIPGFYHTEVLPIRQQSFSYWVERGYTFADSLGNPYPPSAQVKKDALNMFKLRNIISMTDNVTFELGVKILHHSSLNIPFQRVKASEFLTDTQPGPFSLTREEGTRFGLFAQLEHSINKRFRQTFSVLYQHTVAGSRRYRTYFRQMPDAKIQYKADVKPAKDLTLSLTALYRTSTNWSEFKAIEGNHYRLPGGIPLPYTGGPFHTRTPSFANITLSVQKYFWKRHINTQVSVRNVLNDQIRMHPLGTNLPTVFEVKVGVNI